jgi:hypothetical protein
MSYSGQITGHYKYRTNRHIPRQCGTNLGSTRRAGGIPSLLYNIEIQRTDWGLRMADAPILEARGALVEKRMAQ